MNVIKFDPNRRSRRKKNKRVKPQENFKITEKSRLKLALGFAIAALFFQLLIYFPKILGKLPFAFLLLTVIALLMEGIDYIQQSAQKKKENNITFRK